MGHKFNAILKEFQLHVYQGEGVYHKRRFEISMVYQKHVSYGHQKHASWVFSHIHLQLPV
jgi:hypothetical protein